MTTQKRSRVVIVGAGFAGLSAALALARFPVEVLIIDRNNYHVFSPLLHQVATAEIPHELIAYPIRKILRRRTNVQFAQALVKRIDFTSQFVEVDDCPIAYDYLILANGSTPQFFDIPGAAFYTFGLKTLQQAIALRNHILRCFELSAHEVSEEKRRELLTFTIVGGGATGVEFAGSLLELIDTCLVKDYPTLDFSKVRVLLLQAGNRLIPEMPESLSAYTKRELQKMGVDVLLRSRVCLVTESAVHLENKGVIRTATVVWTAGVRGNLANFDWALPITNHNQVAVGPTLQVLGYPQVYAIGDLAAFQQDGQNLPMLAQVAIQQGKLAASNIIRQIKGLNPQPMRYHHPGSMVIIGRHRAVLHARKLKLKGFLAWILWLYVHWVNVVGFRNRLLLFITWIWNYFFTDRFETQIIPLNTVSENKNHPSVHSPEENFRN